MRVIHYEDWRLWADPGPVIARQYDNLTRRLEITGDLPEGWDWTLLVQADREHLDLIALRPMEGGMGVDLTAEMLALSGYYTIQLRGNQGELVRHTNQVRIFIPSSLSGDANWPEVPSEFSQVEANIRELNAHPPYPGDAGYWMVWDLETDTYIQSPLPLPPVAEGPPGKAATITVGETVTGDPDTPAKVENTGTENAAVLRFTIPRGAAGPTGATPDISVEVTGLPAGSEPTVEVSGTPEQPVIALGIPAGRQGEPGGKGDPGTPGKDGPPGQAATVEIAETETVEPGTPAAMVELPESTPQARRYKAQVPQGIQGPAGAGVPPADDVPEDYLLSAGGWVPPPTPSGGISKEASDLLVKILRSAVYTDNQSENIKSLAEKLGADDSGGGESGGDGTLPENGLIALFDMRNITPNIDSQAGLTTIKATKGAGQFYAWSATALVDSDNYGAKFNRSITYNSGDSTTQTDLGEEWSTVILSALDDGITNSLFQSGFVKVSNITLAVSNPRYMTSSGSAALASDQITKPDNSRYVTLGTVVNGKTLKLYINGILQCEYDGSSIDDFVRWEPIGSFVATIPLASRMTCAAIYDRALTDIEIVDSAAYMKTLEVV